MVSLKLTKTDIFGDSRKERAELQFLPALAKEPKKKQEQVI